MDLEISTSANPQRNEFPTHGPMLPPPAGLPQPNILLKKENDPWRGPSGGFGLASILNRNNNAPAPPPLPKFSLPSLHSFGKPLITKPDQSMNRVRSILNNPPASLPMSSDADSRGIQMSDTSPMTSTLKAPVLKETPRKAAPSRRIAPAPAEEDDNEQEEGGPDSIRGGRWSADEHERFLAGFRIHGHKWKRVQQVVRTRSVTQVRTHAQKYLLKLAKLKAEKKQPSTDGANAGSASDAETAGASAQEDSDEKSPRKKPRHQGPSESVDEEYIAAAATTLCFLMRQKIDSLFDSQFEESEKDLEPYDCYSTAQHAHTHTNDDTSLDNSRKRPYMHFITDNSTEYSYGDRPATNESTSYSIDGKQLCS